jgi:hypothetical protein
LNIHHRSPRSVPHTARVVCDGVNQDTILICAAKVERDNDSASLISYTSKASENPSHQTPADRSIRNDLGWRCFGRAAVCHPLLEVSRKFELALLQAPDANLTMPRRIRRGRIS